jgi:hypothetical protein
LISSDDLVARTDRLYHRSGVRAVCGLQTAQEMVRQGWPVIRNGGYEITPEGLRGRTSLVIKGRRNGQLINSIWMRPSCTGSRRNWRFHQLARSGFRMSELARLEDSVEVT